jgi:hypothetical protein
MPLRVAFDLDGTIADMQSVLRLEAERLFAQPTPPSNDTDDGVEEGADDQPEAPPPETKRLRLTREQQSELWAHVAEIENFWRGLPEIEQGIVGRIAETAAARRWEVIFLTTRPFVAGETVQIQSQRWLEAHGFALPSVFVVQRSRGKIAEALALDAVVDDRPENCLDVALDSKAQAILIWNGDQQKAPLGVDRLSVLVVKSIADALDALIKLDDQKHQPSLARTLRKLFGRETTA